jgi:hypothetical protein
MTITLDGKTLNVLSFGESIEVAGTQWDAWVNQGYDRKVKVYGIIRKWTLECVEDSVTWTNSLVNYFETIAQNGSAVAFTSDESLREITSTSVYVLGVELGLSDLGGKNIRKFTLTLQEA